MILRPRDAAKLCGVDVQTLAAWPVPKFKYGNVVGYRPADLVRFIGAHMVQSGKHDPAWEPV